jgi:hypothetical protein
MVGLAVGSDKMGAEIGLAVGSDKLGAEIGVAVGSYGFSDVASKVGFDDVGSEDRRCLVRRLMFLAPTSDVGSEVSADYVGSEVRPWLRSER